MMQAVRVEQKYVGLMGRYVAEGQSIFPGSRLMDIMTPEGIVETILAEGWGVIAHIEGGRVFSCLEVGDERAEDDEESDDDEGESGQGRSSSGGASAVFSKGDVICHIVARPDQGAGQKSGLHPRPSQYLAALRNGLAHR